jgi:hypothetical protein
VSPQVKRLSHVVRVSHASFQYDGQRKTFYKLPKQVERRPLAALTFGFLRIPMECGCHRVRPRFRGIRALIDGRYIRDHERFDLTL